LAESLKLTPSESVEIRTEEPGLLEVIGRYGPGGDPPPAHYHPSQDEYFEVLEGTLRTRVGGTERELGPGEEIEIRRGTPHQMWNPGSELASVAWQTRPAGRTGEWFAAIDRLQREGKVGRNGMPGPLAFAALLTEYRDVFRLAAKPEPLVRGVLAALAPIGRARGYLPPG
jgi:mannose-6-phosphate isomerase-like protein (cupin superfamily)